MTLSSLACVYNHTYCHMITWKYIIFRFFCKFFHGLILFVLVYKSMQLSYLPCCKILIVVFIRFSLIWIWGGIISTLLWTYFRMVCIWPFLQDFNPSSSYLAVTNDSKIPTYYVDFDALVHIHGEYHVYTTYLELWTLIFPQACYFSTWPYISLVVSGLDNNSSFLT